MEIIGYRNLELIYERKETQVYRGIDEKSQESVIIKITQKIDEETVSDNVLMGKEMEMEDSLKKPVHIIESPNLKSLRKRTPSPTTKVRKRKKRGRNLLSYKRPKFKK